MRIISLNFKILPEVFSYSFRCRIKDIKVVLRDEFELVTKIYEGVKDII